MTKQVDLNKYSQFVESVTSHTSNRITSFRDRVWELENESAKDQIPLNVPLLMTAAIGLSSEGGEFSEIVKKILFQGKPYNEENRFHMMRELGDILWYWTNACRALGYDPNDVVAENVKKLQARYPGGEFDVYMSENRRPNDL